MDGPPKTHLPLYLHFSLFFESLATLPPFMVNIFRHYFVDIVINTSSSSVVTIAHAAKTFTYQCQGSTFSSEAQAIGLCTAVDAVVATPITAAENTAAYATITVNGAAILGGLQVEDGGWIILLLAAMTCCEAAISSGRFAAIVASSLYFHVWNTSVYSGSNRTIHPFTLQALPDDTSLLSGIKDALMEGYIQDPTHEESFMISVIARLLSQERKPQMWVNYFNTYRTLVYPTPSSIVTCDGIHESTVFEWIAPAIIGGPWVMTRFAQNPELIKGLQERFGEYVITSIGTESDTLTGEMRLPAVRFLQLSWGDNKYVGSWTQRALAECTNAQSVEVLRKRWELGVIALLELWRCAMRAVDPSATFRLQDLPIFRCWNEHLNKDGSENEDCKCVVRLTDTYLLDELLPNKPLLLTEKEWGVGVWYSSNDNLPAIEGTMCFSATLRLAYQMKLVESKVTSSRLAGWCQGFLKNEASCRPDEKQIYLLFVTNVPTRDIRAMLSAIPSSELPRNLIVVAEAAVVDLVRPFGAGTLASFLNDDNK